MTPPARISSGTLALAHGALRRRREIITQSLEDARRLASRTGATADELAVLERTRDDLAATDAALTELTEAMCDGHAAFIAGLAAAAPPSAVTAGVAEETLGVGATEAPREEPLLRLGPGGDFTRDVHGKDLA
jgi:hypothetical protein